MLGLGCFGYLIGVYLIGYYYRYNKSNEDFWFFWFIVSWEDLMISVLKDWNGFFIMYGIWFCVQSFVLSIIGSYWGYKSGSIDG